jgi:hypothetical protein
MSEEIMTRSIYIIEYPGRSGFGVTTRDTDRESGWDVPRLPVGITIRDPDRDEAETRRTGGRGRS